MFLTLDGRDRMPDKPTMETPHTTWLLFLELKAVFLISVNSQLSFTFKPVLSDHIKQDIVLAFQTGGCLLLHESSAESSCKLLQEVSVLFSFSYKQPPVYSDFQVT